MNKKCHCGNKITQKKTGRPRKYCATCADNLVQRKQVLRLKRDYKVCPVCGKTFYAFPVTKELCSQKCNVRLYNERSLSSGFIKFYFRGLSFQQEIYLVIKLPRPDVIIRQ